MKTFSTIVRALALTTALAAGAADAAVIYSTTSSIAATSPTQQGRLSRNGVPQDWAGDEAYPGVINPTTAYQYTTFFVDVGVTPYIQIDFDSVSANTFVSAYQFAYNPAAGLNVNWLGDAGRSGNLFNGTDPLSFNVVATPFTRLVVVVNTSAAAGIGAPFNLIVEGFISSEYDEFVPEPDTLPLLLAPLAGLALMRLRKSRRGSPASTSTAMIAA